MFEDTEHINAPADAAETVPVGPASPEATGGASPTSDVPMTADEITLPARKPFGPSKFIWWYDSIIDRMLAHPDWKIVDIARDLDRSAAWISTVMGSDTFKLHYARRREDHSAALNDTLAEGIVGRVNAVAIKTLDLISERLDENPLGVSFDSLVALSDNVLSKLGYGPKGGASAGAVTVNTNVVMANETAFREAQSRIRERERTTLELKRA